jgi:tetraacyldisaccharide 4'-kinase
MVKLLGAAWGAIAALRVETFQRGWRHVAQLPRPTMSVGGLSVGGVGKTPSVAAVAELLIAMGARPAILSRGYRREGRKPLLVSRGNGRLLVSDRKAGDEPFWLARTIPSAAVAVASRREEAAELALEAAPVDVFLLDDAYQHLRVERDVNFLVVDASMPFWQDLPIPAGRLRENPSAASRADAFLLVSNGEHDVLPSLRSRYPDRPVFELEPRPPAAWLLTQYTASTALACAGSAPGPPETLPEPLSPTDLTQPLYAFAGIARPSRFFDDLRNAGMVLAGNSNFPDHHAYGPADLQRLQREAQAAGAAALITTEKDAVRIPASGQSMETYVWRYRLQPHPPAVLGKWLLGRMRAANRGAQ